MSFESNKRYQNLLNEKLQELKQAISEFESRVALSDRKEKVTAGRVVLTKIHTLLESLATSEQPRWLSLLQSSVKHFIDAEESTDNSKLLLENLRKLVPHVHAQTWDYLKEENRYPIAEEIADKTYKESKFPDLFTLLANQLEQLIEAEQVSSHLAVKRLQELIKLIRKNAKSTFYSAQYLITFAFRAIRNITTEYTVEYAGPLGEGIRKTIEQMNEEWPDLNEQVHQRVTEAYKASMPSVDLLPAPTSDLCGHELLETMHPQLRIEDKRPAPESTEPHTE